MFELTLNKRCMAPLARVFAAWSSAEQIMKWFAPGEMKVSNAAVDFRVGGAYRIEMQYPDGRVHIVGGFYRDIVQNQRLCFSWTWDGSEVTTEVDIAFHADGDATDITLTHRQFQSTDERDRHLAGWEGCLAKLVKLQ